MGMEIPSGAERNQFLSVNFWQGHDGNAMAWDPVLAGPAR